MAPSDKNAQPSRLPLDPTPETSSAKPGPSDSTTRYSDDAVTLVEWDPDWPVRFQRIAQQLWQAGIPGLRSIEHIGSTAVAGLSAKPIIDLALALDIPAGTPRVVRALESLGYAYFGTFGLRGRHFFRKGDPATIHLHAVHWRSPHWRAWLDFRDALASDPETMERYEREKRELARKYANDRAAYTAAKGPMVRRILAETRQSRKG